MERLIAQLKETPRAPGGWRKSVIPARSRSLEDARNRKHGLALPADHAGRARAGGGGVRGIAVPLLKRIAEICLRRGYPRARIGPCLRPGRRIINGGGNPAPDRLRNNRSPCPPIAPPLPFYPCCRPASPCVIRMIALDAADELAASTVHCYDTLVAHGPDGFRPRLARRLAGLSRPRGSGAFRLRPGAHVS